MSYPTSRRYPRSLAEAWPQHYADPIERYSRNSWGWRTVLAAVICVAAAALIGALAAQGV